MPAALTIEAGFERTDAGDPEERASFALFTIASGPVVLTEGYDDYVKRLRNGPLVSAYHAAEWFVWNWWRLRWEPRTKREDWPFAHQMASIGHGYIWPNITIQSDGARIVFIAKHSTRADAKPFRYISDRVLVVGAAQFEAAVDGFVGQVLDRLAEEGLGETNLSRLWRDLSAERANPDESLRRRLEALIGAEPDEAGDSLEKLLVDVVEVGSEAVSELAADEGATGIHHGLSALKDQAQALGYDAKPRDAVRLMDLSVLPKIGEAPAWKRGADAARALREQERFGDEPISNARLEALVGVSSGAVEGRGSIADLSFALDEQHMSRVVLRSKWRAGRRFQLARLLGDQIAMRPIGKLRPATSAYTYRQQMQRSFAAEFLCPFDALADRLKGDFSLECREDAAHHFDVSELTVRTLLVNRKLLDREDLEEDVESLAAA